MISINETPKKKQGGRYEFEFTGLSSDTKPTHKYKKMAIANGSTFLEMDTQEMVFYDEALERWV